jgi:hypothetical protein
LRRDLFHSARPAETGSDRDGAHRGRGTIANILKENGIDPAPERGAHTRWSTFLKAHWECLTATDFLSVEVCTVRGLVTHYILFFIDIASRSVHIGGITLHPDNSWMTQVARNAHYHHERNHQGLGNRLPIPSRVLGEPGVPVKRRERLGGMLSYYHREAA